MPENRDDYEPIIATRRSPELRHEETRPLWPVVLALGGGLAVVLFLAWWFMGRSPSDGGSTTAETENAAAELGPEIQVEDAPLPSARDEGTAPDTSPPPVVPAPATAPPAPEPATESVPAAGSEPVPEPATAPEQTASAESTPAVVVPSDATQSPATPAAVQVRLMSPDAQVRFELRNSAGSSPSVSGKAGDVVAIGPGTYRVVASGSRLETLEREVIFDGEGAQEYSVELCAERKRERENLVGRVVEERACASTAQCESMFMVLGEEADQLVKDRDFRTQQCAKWRADTSPEGTWTLDTKCDGATAASTCRIEIAAGACTFAEPARSVRGTECPRAELK
jgi:hypothetical protein